ncbi:MAG TPA: peptidoglycan bridge formation glycyltransferase FemA/FemB family protein [Bacteroidia bacterium]|nr:peptidoglycan bridge formation glycyltransferase FemA/FemB family protein [Bacteroidia bacterium]
MKVVTRAEIVKQFADYNEGLMPYFFSEGYESFITESNKDNYLLFFSESAKALMPVRKYTIKTFTILQVIYPPVTITGQRLSLEDEKQFLNEFVELVKNQKLSIRIVQSYSYAVFQSVPDGSVSCPFGTYVIDLTKSGNELFSLIDPKGRNKIRNAQKNEVDLKWGVDRIGDFYTLYKSTMERSKMYVDPIEYFKQMIKCLGGQNILCGVSYVDDKPQAALFIPFTLYSGYYLHSAMAEKMANPGAMDYLQWEAIRMLKANGVKQYDFVGARLSDVKGTKLEGIQNFKKKFGGELVKGYLWKMDIDSLQCTLFDGLLKVNRTLKGAKQHKDIIDEELEKAIK